MARKLPTLVVPQAANVPVNDIPAPEWNAAKDAIARVDPGTPPAPSEFAANIAGVTTWVKMPYIDPTWPQYGMSEANTDTDNGVALNAAANAAVEAGATVKIPAGEFPLRRNLLPSGTIIEGAGKEHTKFIRSLTLSGHAATLEGLGSAGTAIPLAASTSRGANSFTVATDPGLVPGDVVYLTDERAPWGAGNYPDQDIATVLKVEGSGPYTVHVGDTLYHPYDSTLGATMRKLTLWRGGFHGFTIEVASSAIAANGLYLRYAGPKAEIGDVHVTNWTRSAVLLETCFKSQIDRVSVSTPQLTSAGYGYGIRLDLGTRGVDIGHSESRNARHGFDLSVGVSENIVHDSFGYDPIVGPDFICHGVECYHNQFINDTAYAPTVNMGFNAGNNTFGGDYYTLFDRCTGIGSGPGGAANGMFRAMNGSTGTRWNNCSVTNGYYGYHLHLSNDCTVNGGRTVNIADGVYAFGSSGATITSHQFRDATVSAIRNAPTSNYILATSNQFVNVPDPPIQLTGFGHVTTNNVER